MALKTVLAGGGTAGHVNPLLATAQALEERGHHVKIIGTREGLEADLVPGAGFALHTVDKVPLPRRPSKELLTVPRRLQASVGEAAAHLEGADVLVGFGGYVAAPAYLAARRLGIPVVAQEQNVRPGLANRLAARFAAAVSLAFPETKLKAVSGETVVTGMPLRRAIQELADARRTTHGQMSARTRAAARFGLDPARPVLLVTGGSLGAQHLNRVVAEAMPRVPSDVQVLHLTGRGKAAELSQIADGNVEAQWLRQEYLMDMENALAVADLVLCRSGAGTVSELGVLGLPAFYVPLPIGNGEQKRNAAAQVQAGAALLVEDDQFDAGTFLEQVVPLLSNERDLRTMSKLMRKVTPANGAEKVADLAEGVA